MRAQRATPQDIANKTKLHPNTIRNWADQGIIECKRDFRGWRWFPNPQETIDNVERLLNGEKIST